MKLSILASLFFCLPLASQAYFTTDQTAVQITADTALYTITYKFGFSDRAVYMPLFADRGIAANESTFVGGFSVLSDETPTDSGTANGIILTDSPAVEIKDNQYYLPAGKTASFTLVTLVTMTEAMDDVTVLMTNLPFTMINADDLVIPAHLNPSELRYYVTPTLDFAG